jgi:hypothetical protein
LHICAANEGWEENDEQHTTNKSKLVVGSKEGWFAKRTSIAPHIAVNVSALQSLAKRSGVKTEGGRYVCCPRPLRANTLRWKSRETGVKHPHDFAFSN